MTLRRPNAYLILLRSKKDEIEIETGIVTEIENETMEGTGIVTGHGPEGETGIEIEIGTGKKEGVFNLLFLFCIGCCKNNRVGNQIQGC